MPSAHERLKAAKMFAGRPTIGLHAVAIWGEGEAQALAKIELERRAAEFEKARMASIKKVP